MSHRSPLWHFVGILILDAGTWTGTAHAWQDSNKSRSQVAKSAVQIYNDGVLAFQARKYDDAILAFTQAIKKRVGAPNAEAYYARGLCYSQKKEYAKAIGDFTQALAVKPNLVNALVERAAAYNELGKDAETGRDLHAAEKLGASLFQTNRVRFHIAVDYGELPEEVAKEWKSKAEANPDAPPILYYNIGMGSIVKGQYEEAIRWLSKGIERVPKKHPPLYTLRADAYLRSAPKDYVRAAADAEMALMLDPNEVDAVAPLVECYRGLKQQDKLTKLLQRYLIDGRTGRVTVAPRPLLERQP
jgi:tetratricopeptide (TPR) repeat protein